MRAVVLVTAISGLLIFYSASALAAEPIYQSGDFRLLGDSPNHLHLSAGRFDFAHDYASWGGLLEFRYGQKYSFIGPAVGILANTDGGVFIFAAGYADVIWKRVALTPLFGAGLYLDGHSRDLGGKFEFRSSLTISWVFENSSRLGLNVAHISNGNLYPKNPGENEVMISFIIPL